MSIVTAYREKQEQKQEHFLQCIVYFVNPNTWMLTFNVVLGYREGGKGGGGGSYAWITDIKK